MKTIKAIINARIYDYHDYHENGYVIFSETILDSGPMRDFNDQGYEIIDAGGKLLLPGLIAGHTHIYSAFARGWSNKATIENFMDILEKQWWRLDRSLDLATIDKSAVVSAVDHVKNGVTTLIDHHASGTVEGALKTLKHAVCDKVGLRGLFAFETSDRFDVDACIRENSGFLEKSSSFHRGLFGLHASLSLSEKTLEKVKAALGENPIHIHVAESETDETDCMDRYGERVVERLARHGLLNPGSIIAHALHIDENEARLLKEHGCVVALNPSSNMNNGVGVPNYRLLKDASVPVIVGNDGLGAAVTGEYLNLSHVTHLREQTPSAFTLEDFEKTLKDTYEYVSESLGVKLGRLKEGYEADFLLVSYDPPTPMEKTNATGHLFFGLFQSFKPSEVYVAGTLIVHDHEVAAELKDEVAASRDYAAALWEKIRKEGA